MKFSKNFLEETKKIFDVEEKFKLEYHLEKIMKERFKYLNRTRENDDEIIYDHDIQLACAFDHYVYELVSSNSENINTRNISIYSNLVYNQIIENPLSAINFPIFNDPQIAKLCFGKERYEIILSKYNHEMEEADEIMDAFLELVNSEEYQNMSISEQNANIYIKIGPEKSTKLLRALLYNIPNESPKMHECIEKYVEYVMNFYHYLNSFIPINGLSKEILIKFICYEDLKYYEELLSKYGYDKFSHKDVMFILSDLKQNKDKEISASTVCTGGYVIFENSSFICIENHNKNINLRSNFYYNIQAICHECKHIFQYTFSKVTSLKALEVIMDIILIRELGNYVYEINHDNYELEHDANLSSFIRFKHYFKKYLKLKNDDSLIKEVDNLIKNESCKRLKENMIDVNTDLSYNPAEFKFRHLKRIMKSSSKTQYYISRFPVLNKLFNYFGEPKNILDVLAKLDINSEPDFDNTFLEYCQYMLNKNYNVDIPSEIYQLLDEYNQPKYQHLMEKEDDYFGYKNIEKNFDEILRYSIDRRMEANFKYSESESESILFGLLNNLKMIEQMIELINDNFDILVTNKSYFEGLLDFETLNENINNLKESFLKCNLIIEIILRKYRDLRWKEYSYLTKNGTKTIATHFLHQINYKVLNTLPIINNKIKGEETKYEKYR